MAVAKASGDLSASGLEGDGAREVLRGLLAENSDLVEAVTFSEEGKILVAECEGCEGGEGEDISGQEHIAQILRTKNPTYHRAMAAGGALPRDGPRKSAFFSGGKVHLCPSSLEW